MLYNRKRTIHSIQRQAFRHLKTDRLDQHKNIQNRNRGGEDNYYDKPLIDNDNEYTLIDFINDEYDNLI